MSDATKSVIGISHTYVNNQPRILLAFYLDTDEIQITEDAEGRRVALAAFEPDAAYVTLSKKLRKRVSRYAERLA